jgi:hypothetical protein
MLNICPAAIAGLSVALYSWVLVRESSHPSRQMGRFQVQEQVSQGGNKWKVISRAREFPEYAPLLCLSKEKDPSQSKGITKKAAPGSVLQLLYVGKEAKLSPHQFEESKSVAFDGQSPVDVEACRVFHFTAARCDHGVVHSTAQLRTVSRKWWHVKLFGPL